MVREMAAASGRVVFFVFSRHGAVAGVVLGDWVRVIAYVSRR